MKSIQYLSKPLMFTALALQVNCGGSADDFFHSKVENLGYIPYETPMEFAGTGTLVGGQPGALKLAAAPDTCFPSGSSNFSDIRKIDRTTLSSESYEIRFGGNISLDVLSNMLVPGGPGVKFNAKGNLAEKVDLKIDDVEIEYLDLIRLSEYYNAEMRDICKEFLNDFGFIIQALRVGTMTLEFSNANGTAFNLDVTGIEGFVDVGAGIDWEIRNSSQLVIKTPKYVGYQLGRLLDSDNGKAIYRASTVANNRFQFENISLFNTDDAESISVAAASRRTTTAVLDNLFKVDELRNVASPDLFSDFNN